MRFFARILFLVVLLRCTLVGSARRKAGYIKKRRAARKSHKTSIQKYIFVPKEKKTLNLSTPSTALEEKTSEPSSQIENGIDIINDHKIVETPKVLRENKIKAEFARREVIAEPPTRSQLRPRVHPRNLENSDTLRLYRISIKKFPGYTELYLLPTKDNKYADPYKFFLGITESPTVGEEEDFKIFISDEIPFYKDRDAHHRFLKHHILVFFPNAKFAKTTNSSKRVVSFRTKMRRASLIPPSTSKVSGSEKEV